jgi:glycosyltransferase involved in cell wall biosynthesis
MDNSFKTLDFTVLMAVYSKDDPLLFNKAIKSVLNNSILPNKLLIIADGLLSADLDLVITSFKNNYLIQIVRLPENVGLAKALNIGLELISTEFTVRADADDINLPNRFELLVQTLNEGYDLVGSDIQEITKEGKYIAVRKVPSSQESVRNFVKKRNPFNHMSVAFRTSAVIDVDGYPNIHLKEDYALWATVISKNYKVCNIPKVLVHATTGVDMYKRRGGWVYAFSEIKMQKHLVKMKLKTRVEALIDGILRSAIFIAPNSVREWVYLKHLRKNTIK